MFSWPGVGTLAYEAVTAGTIHCCWASSSSPPSWSACSIFSPTSPIRSRTQSGAAMSGGTMSGMKGLCRPLPGAAADPDGAVRVPPPSWWWALGTAAISEGPFIVRHAAAAAG